MKNRFLSSLNIPDWVNEMVKDPMWVSHWLEQKNPEIARHFVSYASQVLEPQTAGMGLQLKTWEDTRVVVKLPCRWKNRTRAGEVHLSALISLAEIATRLFWERHLEPEHQRLRVVSAKIQCSEVIDEDVVGRLEAAPQDLDQWLMDLREGKELHIDQEVPLFNPDGRRLAAVELHVIVEPLVGASAGHLISDKKTNEEGGNAGH